MNQSMVSKIPEVTFLFWLIKIAATTLGETGGDAMSMTLNLGYALSTVIFAACFLLTATAQIRAKSYHPFLYWAVIVATTTVGTTLADFMDRSLGIGYIGGASLLLLILIATLALWHRSCGTISVQHIASHKSEMFYWLTILFSNTLGTALGDFLADTSRFGYIGAAAIFSGTLLLIAALYFTTQLSRTALFWAAFILTRPLGAALGDLLTKAHDHGGLALSRLSATAVLSIFMIAAILLSSKKASHRATTH